MFVQSDMRQAAHAILMIAAPMCLLALGGCRVGGYSKPERENETLRKNVADLSERLSLTTAERDELRIKLRHGIEPSAGAAAADVVEATPKIVALAIDPFSGYVPADQAQPARGVVAYVHTLDGRRRFTQGVGTLTVEVWNSSPSGGSAGSPLSRVVLTPMQLRDAYRSSLTGTHYAVELLLPTPVARTPGSPDSRILRATFMDAVTGEQVQTDHALGLPLPDHGKSKKAV